MTRTPTTSKKRAHANNKRPLRRTRIRKNSLFVIDLLLFDFLRVYRIVSRRGQHLSFALVLWDNGSAYIPERAVVIFVRWGVCNPLLVLQAMNDLFSRGRNFVFTLYDQSKSA